jgi:hypothetical protein
MMDFTRRFRWLLLIILVVIISMNLSCDRAAETRAAREAAKAFHNSFRAQDYEAIYANAAPRFQAIRNKPEYVAMMQRMNNEYGKLINVNEEGAATVVDTGLGQMQVFIFAVEFDKVKATERLTFMRDNMGQMRLWMFELS